MSAAEQGRKEEGWGLPVQGAVVPGGIQPAGGHSPISGCTWPTAPGAGLGPPLVPICAERARAETCWTVGFTAVSPVPLTSCCHPQSTLSMSVRLKFEGRFWGHPPAWALLGRGLLGSGWQSIGFVHHLTRSSRRQVPGSLLRGLTPSSRTLS